MNLVHARHPVCVRLLRQQRIGAALSPALGGVLAQRFGYVTAFAALGAVSLGSLPLLLVFSGPVRHACRVEAPPEPPPPTHEVPLRQHADRSHADCSSFEHTMRLRKNFAVIRKSISTFRVKGRCTT
jgi:hypothetical protein